MDNKKQKRKYKAPKYNPPRRMYARIEAGILYGGDTDLDVVTSERGLSQICRDGDHVAVYELVDLQTYKVRTELVGIRLDEL